MNLPNILTISRLFLTVIFIVLYNQNTFQSNIYALIVFSLASLTDYLDGYFARKHGLISPFGKMMDPIADKFLILSAFYIFMQMHLIFAWVFIVIAAREIIVTGLRLSAIRKGAVLAAQGAGKLKTVLQIVLVYLIIIFSILKESGVDTLFFHSAMYNFLIGISVFVIIVVFVTLWSGISFIWNNRKEIFNVR